MEHHILVSRKKVLVYSKRDTEGNIRYYLYPSGEEIKETNFDCSYETKSSCAGNIYSGYIHGYCFLPVAGLRDLFKEEFKRNMSLYGYFIPVEEYLGTSDNTPLLIIQALLNLKNITKRNLIHLSFDKEEAKEQLKSIGCIQTTKVKTI